MEIQRAIQEFLEVRELDNCSPKTFRTYEQLGHTTLKMTDHYASLSIEQLQKSHEKYSPLRKVEDSENDAFGRGYWTE